MLLLCDFLKNTLHLFYPHNCTGCGNDLLPEKEMLCLSCLSALPYTKFEKFTGNPVEKIFYGRLAILAAHSEFYFSKGQLIQHLLHQLKYNNNKNIGRYLGKILGNHLLESGRFLRPDYLVPLAMSAKKEFKRGYNQATIICEGIAEVLHTPLLSSNIVRTRTPETQTKKHRAERWENVEGSFAVTNSTQLEGKHILLVDDVLTTGATLEACCNSLKAIPGISISIATLAFASK